MQNYSFAKNILLYFLNTKLYFCKVYFIFQTVGSETGSVGIDSGSTASTVALAAASSASTILAQSFGSPSPTAAAEAPPAAIPVDPVDPVDP
jgi:hypothetical protein